MIRTFAISTLIGLAAMTASYASDDKGDKDHYYARPELSTPMQKEFRQNLEKQGYKILKFKNDDDGIEVYANKNGNRWELTLDPNTGRIVKAERDD